MKLKNILKKLVKEYDCFYLYDENSIIEYSKSLKINFPQIDFLYSIKCNSNCHVLNSIFEQGFGADAASLKEVLLANETGLPKEKIYYSAPGKTLKDIEKAINKANLIADSIDEIKRIQMIAEQIGTIVKIGIRINPDFTFYNEHGQPSKFGIDEQQAIDFVQNNKCKNIKIVGIHVHLKSQELNANILTQYYLKMFQFAEKFQQICGGLEYINMGSGMGIQYSANSNPLDMAFISKAIKDKLSSFRVLYPNTKIIIEVGRYIVCKSGIYITKVLDCKVSYGKTYLILKNTLNGFLRPSLAKLVQHYSTKENPEGLEPLFTCKDAFEFLTLKEDKPSEIVTLVGNLCTTTDIVAEDIMMPHLECGDNIIITNAGSYAAVLTPMQFCSQEIPIELFLTVDGKIKM